MSPAKAQRRKALPRFLTAFFATLRLRAHRGLALTADLKFATAVQSWRIGGYSFLILSAYGYFPGYFAWPAGVGDMFIGVTAPLLLKKMKNPDFTKSRAFAAWNVFGILDLVVAVGLGALCSLLMGNPVAVSPVTIMSRMPLVLIPTFLFPRLSYCT